MASTKEMALSKPSNINELCDHNMGNVKREQEAKKEVGIAAEPHIEAAATDVGPNDAELEARLKRLDQLRNHYGVRNGHQVVIQPLANGPDI